MKYLYRGVSERMFSMLNGKLTPKKRGEEFSAPICYGEPHAVFGSGVVYGNSDQNSVVLHQWDQKGYPTSGLSFSPYIDRAKFYATSGDKTQNGWLFKIDVEKAKALGVKIYDVNTLVPNPAIPEDCEHILVAHDFGAIPEGCVVEITRV
ncbi:hypothetical protein VH1709_contig00112-0004 [Vibrio harveyi]|uniref:hypothetical protein n=1 Tax=Vibrio harveyi TaxID=669 RepID=UPI000D787A21|nr:hypothetical protein [Vibrio harveyi]GBL02408.1 hypothetical protein VH1709_contig00112-0004 [Vibrio harveyi]